MPILIILLSLVNVTTNRELDVKLIPYYSIGKLVSSSYIIVGEVSKIDSQIIHIKPIEILRGRIKSSQIKIANNFYDNYMLERHTNKGTNYWHVGEKKFFFLKKPYYEDELKDNNIYRVAHLHEDSEIKIIESSNKKFIEQPYRSWYSSFLRDKYEELRKRDSLNTAIKYEYHEMKDAIMFFSKKRKKLKRKVRQTIKENFIKDRHNKNQWDGTISNKWLKKIQQTNTSYERLLDDLFDNISTRIN